MFNRKVKIKKTNDRAIIPTRGSKYAAGYDLYANIKNAIGINPHETVKIGTGVAIKLPKNHFGAIFARSGMATKKDLAPANKVGVIDPDYTGEIVVALHNHSNVISIVEPNERIAQLVVLPYLPIKFTETHKLPMTIRGEGGFGSTGTH